MGWTVCLRPKKPKVEEVVLGPALAAELVVVTPSFEVLVEPLAYV